MAPFRGQIERGESVCSRAQAENAASFSHSEWNLKHSLSRITSHRLFPKRCRSKYAEMSMGITTFMRELIDPYWWTVALTSLVQFVLFLRWLYRRIRNDEMTRTFVEDMATSHLPHIYRLLEKLCNEKGIETPPEPPIRWVNLNGPHH
jgi:hypothetical protein